MARRHALSFGDNQRIVAVAVPVLGMGGGRASTRKGSDGGGAEKEERVSSNEIARLGSPGRARGGPLCA